MRIGDKHGKTRFVDIIAYEEWIKRGSPEPNGKHAGSQSSGPMAENMESEPMFFQPHYGLRRELSVPPPSFEQRVLTLLPIPAVISKLFEPCRTIWN